MPAAEAAAIAELRRAPRGAPHAVLTAPPATAPTAALLPVPTFTFHWLRVLDDTCCRATAAAARGARDSAIAVDDHRANDAMPDTTRVAAMWMCGG